MRPETGQLVIALAGLAVVLVIAGWDAVVLWLGRPELTITAIIQSWSGQHPVLLLAVGLILGHLFWPARQLPK